jgi:hypothetical protein
MPQNTQNILMQWSYEENKDRSPIWYIIALSIAIWLIIWWFFTRQYGMSIVIMLISWFFFFLENNADDQVQVTISEQWIKVQWNFYDYAKISWFYLVYEWEQAIFLRIGVKKNWIRTLSVRIDNFHSPEARRILSHYLEESEKQELSVTEKILHFLKI